MLRGGHRDGLAERGLAALCRAAAPSLPVVWVREGWGRPPCTTGEQ